MGQALDELLDTYASDLRSLYRELGKLLQGACRTRELMSLGPKCEPEDPVDSAYLQQFQLDRRRRSGNTGDGGSVASAACPR